MMESSVSASVLVPHTCFTDISQHPPSTCNMVIVIRAFINSQLGPFVFARPKAAEWLKKTVLNGSRLSLCSSSESGGCVGNSIYFPWWSPDSSHLLFIFYFFHQDELHNHSTSFLTTLLNYFDNKIFSLLNTRCTVLSSWLTGKIIRQFNDIFADINVKAWPLWENKKEIRRCSDEEWVKPLCDVIIPPSFLWK